MIDDNSTPAVDSRRQNGLVSAASEDLAMSIEWRQKHVYNWTTDIAGRLALWMHVSMFGAQLFHDVFDRRMRVQYSPE